MEINRIKTFKLRKTRISDKGFKSKVVNRIFSPLEKVLFEITPQSLWIQKNSFIIPRSEIITTLHVYYKKHVFSSISIEDSNQLNILDINAAY